MSISLVAKYRNTESDGAKQYTLFSSLSSYSLGCLRVEADGTAVPYCLGADNFGYHHSSWNHFPSAAAALASVRADYEAALSRYHQISAEVFEILRSGTGLSEIKKFGVYATESQIIVDVIDTHHQGTASGTNRYRIHMTVQEALTCMDWLSERSEGRFVPVIVGWVTPETERFYNRHGYCKWEIPALHSDYVIAGWTSTTGRGREHQTKFMNAINRIS